MTRRPDLTVPGFLLNDDKLEALIDSATMMLFELGPDQQLENLIKGCRAELEWRDKTVIVQTSNHTETLEHSPRKSKTKS